MLMSSPDRNRKIVLSPCARQDFIDILRFTGETWGQGQLHVYRDKINDAL
jgi:toxin ParE1/3/4